jgi:hypothetical protein
MNLLVIVISLLVLHIDFPVIVILVAITVSTAHRTFIEKIMTITGRYM